MKTKYYKVKVSYDGTNFSGWAKQDNVITVQEEIENTLSNIFNEKIKIFGSGRTDKYVHAIDQCFNFKVKTIIPTSSLKKIINKNINRNIFINSICETNDSFHSRFSIKSKTYLYKMNLSKFNLFEQNYCWQYCNDVDINKIKKIKKLFIGEKNFLSFSTSTIENPIRTIFNISIKKESNYLIFKIKGNGFLRNMVRMIVATFINYSENKISFDEIQKLFDNPKKGSAISKAPGCGLYLYKTTY